MMEVPIALSDFDIDNAAVSVWLFRKSGGGNGNPPTFSGRWVATDDKLKVALRESAKEARSQIKEVHEYGLLAQNNEESALKIDSIETHMKFVVDVTMNPLPSRKVTKEQHLSNVDFFVTCFSADETFLYCVRKTDASWKSKKRFKAIDIIFSEEALTLEDSPSFSLSKYVDFFAIGDAIIIPNKANFESILSYKQAHANEFVLLQNEPEFSSVFVDLTPLVAYVGDNKIQLRRMCSIRQKGHYKNPQFLQNLQRYYVKFGLNLAFDVNGILVISSDSCRDVMTALLDHRLSSAFSENIYDVPDATKVA